MIVRIFSGVLFFAAVLFAKVNIITSIPDIADITREVGGQGVTVFSLAKGSEDVHLVRARSSFLPKINRAHLVISLGLMAESRWLDAIVNAARNKKVIRGGPGWIEAYKGLKILEQPVNPEDITKDVGHKHGNPHFNSGPYCGKTMAKNIYEAIVGVDPKNKAYYTKRYNVYIKRLDDMEKRLLEKAAPLKGKYVISYHADLAYFCHFYKMNITGHLEPKPGIPPNSKHLAKLVTAAKRDGVCMVLYHQAQNPRLPKKIAMRVGAELVCFANMVKSRPNINTFIEFHEFNLEIMLNALKRSANK